MKRKLIAIAAITLSFIFINFQVRGTAFAIPGPEAVSLHPGSSGTEVKALQAMLKDAGLYNGSIDGIYGIRTAESVKKMQKYVGVKPDGIFGPKTLAAYNSIVAEAKSVQIMLEIQADRAFALDGKTIGIDAGHQRARDNKPEQVSPGSERTKIRMSEGSNGVRTGTGEYSITLVVAKKLSKLLEESGADVVMTRSENDVNLSNKERAELMNREDVDIWIRLHCDASSSPEQNGARVVIPSYLSNPEIYGESRNLGTAVLDSFCKETGAHNNEMYQRSDQTGFNWSDRPVITLEMGYLSNPGDDVKLNRDSYQDDCAKGISDGIIRYFGKGKK